MTLQNTGSFVTAAHCEDRGISSREVLTKQNLEKVKVSDKLRPWVPLLKTTAMNFDSFLS